MTTRRGRKRIRTGATGVALVAALLLPSTGQAAGFLIFEAGARALGMGGALTAQADDPSAIFFNPAGIAHLEGTNVYLGVSTIFTETQFAGVDPDPGFGITEKTGTLFFTPINAYATWEIRPGLAAGVGLFNMYGLGQKWNDPDRFTGRHISYDAQLRTFYINPSIAWSPADAWSFGLGLQLVHATVEIRRSLQVWDPNGAGFVDTGNLTIEGDNGLDFGFNIGGRYVWDEPQLTIGAHYRSRIAAEFEGMADFTQVASGDSALDAAVALQFPNDQSARTQINLPWLLSIGVAYGGVERWVFEMDFNLVGWSEFAELPFLFENDPSLNTVRVQDYEDTWSIRTGASFDATDIVTLRGGYYYDPTPQPQKSMSPLLADADRHGLSLGVGYAPTPWSLDFFLLLLLAGDRDTGGQSLDGYEGTYRPSGTVLGVNFGYQF